MTGDRARDEDDSAGHLNAFQRYTEGEVTDHIGYPLATVSYTGTVQWQPDPLPFGDVYPEQAPDPHDPLLRYPGQWRLDPILDTSEPAFTTHR